MRELYGLSSFFFLNIRCTSAICCESHRLSETCLVFRLSKETKRVGQMTPRFPCQILRSSSKICSGFCTPCTFLCSTLNPNFPINFFIHRPSQLLSTSDTDSPSLEKLLNIAELTNKYCIASYESWALERILSLAQNPVGFLRHAPPTMCARVLNIAALSNHKRLLDTITHRLIARMLWSDIDRQPILDVAQARGLRKLQGVVYYKELVDLEKMSFDVDGYTSSSSRPVFPPSTSVEKRMRFLAAHHSLVNLWECVRTTPPVFVEHGCASHAECLTAWTDLWVGAAEANQTLRHGSADVLGRLKSMMIVLKKTMMESSYMSLGCVLGALEAITTTRDDIVAGLMDHFQEEY